MKAPFPIPAINNEFELLAIELGIADDNDQERSQIVAHGKRNGVSRFEYQGKMYSVAKHEMYRLGTVVHTYNGNLFSIKEEKASSVTH